MDNDKLYKAFPITSVCRADMLERFTQEQIDTLDDADMEYIASKMADAYCDQNFWEDLKILTIHVLGQKN